MADKAYGDVVAGGVDYTIGVLLRKLTDSTPDTAIPASSVTAYYYRQGAAAPVQIPVVAGSLTTHADGGWAEVSASLYPGVYVLHLPDAAIATGVDWVNVQVRVSTSFNHVAEIRLQSAALIPDQILKRDWATMVDDIGIRRCLWNALRPLRNRWVLTPTAYSVKKEDDNTEAWSASVSTVAGAAPVTAIDPS